MKEVGFKSGLKVARELVFLTVKGREFQSFGPKTEKALFPISVLVRDISSSEFATRVE